jgi:hypothetical protein
MITTADLSADQQELQDAAIRFARTTLGHDMFARDREERFSREDWESFR